MKTTPIDAYRDAIRFLQYSPRSGHFTWLETRGRLAKKGDRAGRISNRGYRRICINGRDISEHRLAWYFVHGQIPPQVDHINGVRDDNRICNLRVATNSQNCINAKPRRDNSSGVKGVSWHKATQKWTARISINKKEVHLGVFETLEEAKAARIGAEAVHYGEYAPSKSRP